MVLVKHKVLWLQIRFFSFLLLEIKIKKRIVTDYPFLHNRKKQTNYLKESFCPTALSISHSSPLWNKMDNTIGNRNFKAIQSTKQLLFS